MLNALVVFKKTKQNWNLLTPTTGYLKLVIQIQLGITEVTVFIYQI